MEDKKKGKTITEISSELVDMDLIKIILLENEIDWDEFRKAMFKE